MKSWEECKCGARYRVNMFSHEMPVECVECGESYTTFVAMRGPCHDPYLSRYPLDELQKFDVSLRRSLYSTDCGCVGLDGKVVHMIRDDKCCCGEVDVPPRPERNLVKEDPYMISLTPYSLEVEENGESR